jgi:hypothetical protein
MTKNEWLWVSVRITGLAFLVMAVAAVPDAISGAYAAIQYGDIPLGISSAGDTSLHNMVKAAKAFAIKSVIQASLYTIASFYFIKRGKLVHEILSKECNA